MSLSYNIVNHLLNHLWEGSQKSYGSHRFNVIHVNRMNMFYINKYLFHQKTLLRNCIHLLKVTKKRFLILYKFNYTYTLKNCYHSKQRIVKEPPKYLLLYKIPTCVTSFLRTPSVVYNNIYVYDLTRLWLIPYLLPYGLVSVRFVNKVLIWFWNKRPSPK